jgi:uncharacterized membrane-anchored protein YhcB (DUF1043 family)
MLLVFSHGSVHHIENLSIEWEDTYIMLKEDTYPFYTHFKKIANMHDTIKKHVSNLVGHISYCIS